MFVVHEQLSLDQRPVSEEKDERATKVAIFIELAPSAAINRSVHDSIGYFSINTRVA